MAQKKFSTTDRFGGYRTKTDETNLESNGFLVSGSQNVVSTDGDTVAIRGGYTIYGRAKTGNYPIQGSYEWKTHRGTELALRSFDDELEVYSSNDGDWIRLGNTFTAVDFQFAEYWDTAEAQDLLLFVNGTSNIYSWSGGMTTYASSTVNTITKEGSTTWGAEGFLTTGTRSVIIGGITYAYTGGEGTTTLTGVTPDPTAGGHTAGDTVIQAVRTTATTPASGFNNDIIAVLDNQVYVGSNSHRDIYKSVVDNFASYSFSSPRLVGEGAVLTLDQTPTAFIPQEEVMNISAGKDFWYTTVFELSDDLTKESVSVKRLKTNPGQAALQQSAVGYMKNYVAFISNEPTLDILGRLESIDTIQSKPLSDPIKPDFDSYDFTGAHIRYFKNNLYITVPVESKLLVYNVERGFWEPPWTLPAGRLAEIGGELYLHSNSVDETYKLFQGNSDYSSAEADVLPINAIARFNYMNGGARAIKKAHDEWFSEGYISPNTTLNLDLYYDYAGSEGTVTKQITGTLEQDTIFALFDDWSLGKHKLGAGKHGGDGSASNRNKFRIVHEMPLNYYFEIQPQYSSYDTDQYWEILSYGSNMSAANDEGGETKQ